MYDVIIIGSGPAGLTSATYTSRAKLKTLLVAGKSWGGQLMFTGGVENFPGFEEGISGPDLMTKMLKQTEKFGAEIIFEDATEVKFESPPLIVQVGTKTYHGKTVIIATGASPKWLGLESEERLRGKGVSVCATCDAPFFKDKKVVVVGGGDTAIEEGLTLSKFAREVKVVHRRDTLRASKILQEEVFKNPKIEFVWNSVVLEVLGDQKVEGVKLLNVDSKERSNLACDGVFIAIGYKPNSDLFKGKIELDKHGYIVACNKTATSVEGVFVAGDVEDHHYRQAITAAGAGCQAALDVEKHLSKKASGLQ